MLENLQKGDKIIRNGEIRKVLGVCGNVVFYAFQLRIGADDFEGCSFDAIDSLERLGWQLEKKKWVPSLGEKYYFVIMSGGEITYGPWNNDNTDRFNLEINNISRTQEEAKAYRNKLVEVMGREGV